MASPDLPWTPSPGEILTVSELLGRARSLLETSFCWIWVEGEVGNLRIPASGHAYFTIGDGQAQIRAVCFRSTLRLLPARPGEGAKVLARGRLTLYEARGDVQFVVEDLEPLGEGLSRLELEERKRRLSAEGLFDPARKRSLPALPRAVGVVTSSTGAAVRDILNVLGRRAPGISVYLAPARVQGREAPGELRAALETVVGHPEVDVVILGRGGGSAEDLAPFNDEELVRAVAASPVPVISAVGHETDVTLVDFAAAARAPTPSAAAEMAAKAWGHTVEQVRRAERDLGSALLRKTAGLRLRLERLDFRSKSPAARIDRARIRLDRAVEAMDGRTSRLALRRRSALAALEARLAQADPERRVAGLSDRLGRLEEGLVLAVRRRLEGRRRQLLPLESRMQALSPLAVLSRGYAIARKGGMVLREASQCRAGDAVQITLAQGGLDCVVDTVRPSGGEK